MKFLKNLGLVVLGIIAFAVATIILTLLFIVPYIVVTGQAPHILLVQAWYIFCGAIAVSIILSLD